MAWLYDIYLKTGIKVPFPIIADRSGSIARKYGMIANEISNTQTVRNVFIIDTNGIVRTILVYPMQTGRCIPEILRLIEALQTADETNTSTPANWVPGNPVIQAMPTTYTGLEERMKEIQENQNGMSWYLSFTTGEACNRSLEKESVKEIETKSTDIIE